MLYINKIDDKNVSFRIDNGDENAKAARYFADQVNGFVTINRTHDGEVLFGPLRFDELTINGEAPTSAADAVQRLNLFLGNFKNGGGSSPSPTPAPDRTKPILFFDYDGTLLHSYTREEAQALSALPGLPTHEYLTGTGWTHTLEQVKSAQALHVGAMYRTTDGKTHAFVTVTPTSGRNPRLRFKINGTATIRIDWGDGQTQDISTNSDYEINHTYQVFGNYVITLERISGTGTYTLGNGTSETFIGTSSASIRQMLTKLYIGDNATISAGAFYRNTSLASVVIPESVTSVEHSPFESCYSLTFVVLPVSLTSTGNGNTFRECLSLTSAVIPDSFTTIGFQTFLNCYSLRSITLPASVTEIGSGAFSSCFALNEIIIAAETPPTLTSGAFTDGTSIRKIYVPDASVAAYKAAPNWSTLADYIYPISERP